MQNPGLEEKTPQEAPPEDAPTLQQCTSPTEAYKRQKDKLQRLPPQPFEQPPIPKLVDSSSNALSTPTPQISKDLQVSPKTYTKSETKKLSTLPQKRTSDSETETPTPQLRSRRARPIHAKHHPDMIYY